MSHRYYGRVQVHSDGQGPVDFSWRGRRYLVREVFESWVEAVPWWSHHGKGHGAPARRTVWRVEAITRTGSSGVYDLCVTSDRWRLLRVID